MTVTVKTPTVDRTGTHVDILAVKYGTATVADRGPDGDLIAFDESWDAESVILPTPGTRVRFLNYHDRRTPIGWLDRFHIEPDGLHASGTLVGSASNLDQLRALAADGLLSDVSIGFSPDVDADVWAMPVRKNGLAHVVRRRARIREISLVDQAALPGSRLLTIRQPATSPFDNPVVKEAERLKHSGYGGKLLQDQQIADDEARREREAVLAEADRLLSAGDPWTARAVQTEAELTRQTAAILHAQDRTAARDQDWHERMNALLERRPTTPLAWAQWQTAHRALMDERHPTRR